MVIVVVVENSHVDHVAGILSLKSVPNQRASTSKYGPLS